MAGRNDNRDTRGDVRGEIREFLSTRRARISPAQAGLPTYGGDRRRVSGLRREEVALLAGISSEYYTRLERGNATGVSESVIDGIAHALQLDEAERAHLLDLIRTAGTTRPPRRRPARQRVRLTRSEEFRVRWAAHHVRIHTTGMKRFRHPVVGELELAFESFPLAADPSQGLLTYTAEPGSPSQDALNLLASWAATTDIEQPASTDDSQQAESFETPD